MDFIDRYDYFGNYGRCLCMAKSENKKINKKIIKIAKKKGLKVGYVRLK